jgi:hypothetical protein
MKWEFLSLQLSKKALKKYSYAVSFKKNDIFGTY